MPKEMPEGLPISNVLEDLAARNGAGQDVDLADVLDLTGSRMHGTAIFLLALPDAIPAPIPSLAAVLGIPLVAISGHLAVYGETGGIPRRFATMSVPGRMLDFMARYAVPILSRMERVTRPRFVVLIERERLIGLLCLILSLILLLPIPFMNTPPAIALALVAWGLVQKDGVFVAMGAAATLFLVLLGVVAGGWLADFLGRVAITSSGG